MPLKSGLRAFLRVQDAIVRMDFLVDWFWLKSRGLKTFLLRSIALSFIYDDLLPGSVL